AATRPQVDVAMCRISTGGAQMRTDRRTFLKDVAGAAGLVFVGCGVTGVCAQSAQRAGVTRRPVVVKGRRITTVDIHAHCAVPQANDLLRRSAPAPAATQGSLLALDGEAPGKRVPRQGRARNHTPRP